MTHERFLKADDRCVTRLVKMSIDLRYVELTADVFVFCILNIGVEESLGSALADNTD